MEAFVLCKETGFVWGHQAASHVKQRALGEWELQIHPSRSLSFTCAALISLWNGAFGCIWAGKAGWNHQWPKFSAELVLWMSAAFPLHPRFKRQSVRLFASERKLPWWGGCCRSCLRKHLGLGFTLTSVGCNFWVKQRLSSEVAVQAGRFPLGWPAPFVQKNSSKNST